MNVNFPDAVVVLAYFCENHGARVVMTTQAATRTPVPLPVFPLRRTNLPWDKIAELQDNATNAIDILSVMECGKQEEDIMEERGDELIFGNWDRTMEIVDEEERCPACTSLGDDGAHIANDYHMKMSFVTTQTALNDDCYMTVKKAVFRAMFSEKLNPLPETPASITFMQAINAQVKNVSKALTMSKDPNDEGILLFGNSEDGYTAVVRTFIIKDAKSRGFQRRYLLMALSENRDLMMWNYKMLEAELSATARLLQIAANTVYLEEQKFDRNTAMRTAKYLPHEFFKSKIEIDTTRRLEVLVNDQKCYTLLHRDFVGILQRLLAVQELPLPKEHLTMELSSEMARVFACEAVNDLKAIQRRLQPGLLKTILWHLCIGRQLVVRSNAEVARKQFLFAFTPFLPDNCVAFEPNATAYKTVGEANLLGLPLSVKLPQRETDEILILRLDRNLNEKERHAITVLGYDVVVEHLPTTTPHKTPPTIVQRYWKILEASNKMKLRSFLHAIGNEKQEYMGLVETIESTCTTTKKKLGYLKFFHCPPSDIDTLNFWRRAAQQYPPVTLDLFPIDEELDEDIQFINKSFEIASISPPKIPNGHLSHDSIKVLNGACLRPVIR